MKTWERILADLIANEWVCGSYWYANYTPTFAQRISLDIKPRGYAVESRPCKRHEHKGGIHEYRLNSCGPSVRLTVERSVDRERETPRLSSERFDATSDLDTRRGHTQSSARSGTGEQRPDRSTAVERIGSGQNSQTPPALRGAQARPATWEPEADDPASELPTDADGHTAEQLSLLAGGETASLSLRAPAGDAR